MILKYIFLIFIILILLEIIIRSLVKFFKKDFIWFITDEDEYPPKLKTDIKTFYKKNYSYKLGWNYSPNLNGTEILDGKKTFFKINKLGYRETKNRYKSRKIILLGDSFAFARYVNDNETWSSYLEKNFKTKIYNYGVGNFGLDQSIIKYDTIKNKKKAELVILAVVPETILRIHSIWKHYLEFGNVFGFKPSYIIKKNKLFNVKNPLERSDDFKILKKKINSIKKKDIFYNHFLKYKFSKIYLFTYFRSFFYFNKILFYLTLFKFYKKINSKRSSYYFKKSKAVVLKKNIILSYKFYKSYDKTSLIYKMLINFNNKLKKEKKKLLILFIPQLIDLEIEGNKKKGYINFTKSLNKKLNIVDFTYYFKKERNINKYYLEDKYGGHLSKKGNKFVSIKLKKILKKFLN